MLTQHPALPNDMARLRGTFTDEVDLEWVRRFVSGDDGVIDPAHESGLSVVTIGAYLLVVGTVVMCVLLVALLYN